MYLDVDNSDTIAINKISLINSFYFFTGDCIFDK